MEKEKPSDKKNIKFMKIIGNKNNKSNLIHTEEPLLKHPQSQKIKNKNIEFFLTVHFLCAVF